jgi:hypothetical protein
LKDSLILASKMDMKLIARRNQGFSCWVKTIASFRVIVFSLFLFASGLLAAEPGPEADGVYSCGKEEKGKYVELGKLEIKGKTYATYSEQDISKEKKSFAPFTTDEKGNISFRTHFNFLNSYAQLSGSSQYSVGKDGIPTIMVNYGQDHRATFMICTKEK